MAFVQSPPGTFPMMPCKARTLPPSKLIRFSNSVVFIHPHMSSSLLCRTALKLSPGPGRTQSSSYWSSVRIKDLLGPQVQLSSQDCSALGPCQGCSLGLFSTACKSDLDSGSLRERCLIMFPCDFKLREHKRRAGPDRSCVVSQCIAQYMATMVH